MDFCYEKKSTRRKGRRGSGMWGWGRATAAKSLQSCPTLCDPIDGRPQGSPCPKPGRLGCRSWEEWAVLPLTSWVSWRGTCIFLFATSIFWPIFAPVIPSIVLLRGRSCLLEEEGQRRPSRIANPWKIPWMEEPCRLQSMGSQRVGHDWVTSLSLFTFMPWRKKWQPTPVFLPGESQGRGSLVGCHPRGHTESDTTEAT